MCQIVLATSLCLMELVRVVVTAKSTVISNLSRWKTTKILCTLMFLIKVCQEWNLTTGRTLYFPEVLFLCRMSLTV